MKELITIKGLKMEVLKGGKNLPLYKYTEGTKHYFELSSVCDNLWDKKLDKRTNKYVSRTDKVNELIKDINFDLEKFVTPDIQVCKKMVNKMEFIDLESLSMILQRTRKTEWSTKFQYKIAFEIIPALANDNMKLQRLYNCQDKQRLCDIAWEYGFGGVDRLRSLLIYKGVFTRELFNDHAVDCVTPDYQFLISEGMVHTGRWIDNKGQLSKYLYFTEQGRVWLDAKLKEWMVI